jgi:hypothetical protein
MRLPILALLLWMPSLDARAQAYDTPLLVLGAGHPYAPEKLYAVDLFGNATVRHVFGMSFFPNSFTHHHDNRTLTLHYTNPDAIVLFDPVLSTVTGTLHQGLPLGNVYSVRPYSSGDYLVGDVPSAIGTFTGAFVRLVRADGSGLQTLFSQPGWSAQVRAVGQDLVTGEILAGLLHIGPGTAPSLIRITPDTGAYVTLDPTPRSITALVQDHRDGAVIYGAYNGGIFRRAPDGAISTLIPAANPWGITASSLAFDRGAEHGILVAGGSGRIARIAFDPGGPATVVAVHEANLPQGLPAVKDLGFEHERNVISRRTGNLQWVFEINFPGEPYRPYVLALSLTGFTPGIPLGGRTVPLVPDPVFFASLSGGLFPLLQGNVGTLDQDGRAVARLDLSSFGAVSPVDRVWMAAATLDGAAPGGVRTIGKPSVLVLR